MIKGYYLGRKLFLPNYSKESPYESEEYGVEADTEEEAKQELTRLIEERKAALKGQKKIQTKE
jgi:hypothetical protein